MNDTGRVDLFRVTTLLDTVLQEVSTLLENEREYVRRIPEDVDELEVTVRIIKRPMYELAHGRVLLVEAIDRFRSAATKA